MNDELEFPSAEEMAGWLQREIKDSTKASELRIKDAASFVTEYASGKITSEEAEQKMYQYSKRWGDALPGIAGSGNLSDEEIIKHIDETRLRRLKLMSSNDPNLR